MRPDQIGPYIRHFRRKAKISQGELAKRAGVSRNCIALLESQNARKRNVKIATLYAIFGALGFGVSVRLIKPQEEPTPTNIEEPTCPK